MISLLWWINFNTTLFLVYFNITWYSSWLIVKYRFRKWFYQKNTHFHSFLLFQPHTAIVTQISNGTSNYSEQRQRCFRIKYISVLTTSLVLLLIALIIFLKKQKNSFPTILLTTERMISTSAVNRSLTTPKPITTGKAEFVHFKKGRKWKMQISSQMFVRLLFEKINGIMC